MNSEHRGMERKRYDNVKGREGGGLFTIYEGGRKKY